MAQPLIPSPQPVTLGRQGEAEWQRLRRQLELADGFWLGFVFTPDPRVATALRDRAATFLRGRVRRLELIQPASPGELRHAITKLFSPVDPAHGCRWLECLSTDPPGRKGGEWTEAWDAFALRLNERRDRLRRHVAAGVIIVAPPTAKPRIRDAAPDLWSVRALVLEPPGLIAEPLDGRISLGLERVPTRGEVATASVRRRRKSLAGAASPRAVRLLSRAEGLLADGATGEAVSAASAAVEALKAEGAPAHALAEGLWTLARAEAEDGDPAAALEHIDRALELNLEESDSDRVDWLSLRGGLHKELGALEEAAADYSRAVELLRSQVRAASDAEVAEVTKRLSASLDQLGGALLRLAKLGAARQVFEEALEIDRRVCSEQGEKKAALLNLVHGLHRIGDVRLSQGDLSGASAAYEESMSLALELLSHDQSDAKAIIAVALSLSRLGNSLRLSGDISKAASAFKVGLSMARLLLREHGETAEHLQMLSSLLVDVGDNCASQGDLVGALSMYEESLSIARRLVSEHGESAHRLRELAVILDRVGDTRRARGDLSSASPAYKESYEITRRLLSEFGEDPQLLRDLSISLDRIARIRLSLDDWQGVSEAYEEIISLCRRSLAEYGASAERLRDLSMALDRIAVVQEASEQHEAALASLEEAVTISRELAESYPEFAQHHSDLEDAERLLSEMQDRLKTTT